MGGDVPEDDNMMTSEQLREEIGNFLLEPYQIGITKERVKFSKRHKRLHTKIGRSQQKVFCHLPTSWTKGIVVQWRHGELGNSYYCSLSLPKVIPSSIRPKSIGQQTLQPIVPETNALSKS
jgi:hypothetical protein